MTTKNGNRSSVIKGGVEYKVAAPFDPTDTMDEEEPILVEHHRDDLSAEERFEIERENARASYWRESPYAVGKVEPTWEDERNRYRRRRRIDDHFCSAYICSLLGAKRVGNMSVLKESNSATIEEGKRIYRRQIDIVVGPYWPMMLCITYPLILGVSMLTAFRALPHVSWLLRLIWVVLCGGLCFSLFSIAFRDPGIQLRIRDKPEEGSWVWNDQALTWRTRGSLYDPDCGCVIEEFDHTCPWTGTAIGKNNLTSFHSFVCLIFVNMLIDVFLLTSVNY